MNIGSIKATAAGTLVGKISTLQVSMTIALREVRSQNPRAPKYEIFALSAAKEWVQVGALFELASNSTGEFFLNGKIEDPSLERPIFISCFQQDDGSYNVVWSRPTRRRDVDSAMTPKQSDDALPPLPGEQPENSQQPEQPADQPGVGDSTADSNAFN